MGKLGFKKMESDGSILVWLDEATGTRIIAPVYVDNITLAGKDKAKIAWVKAELKKHFKLCDLGPVEFLLGVHVIRDHSKHTIQLSQRQAIVDILHKFNMQNCSPVSTPMDPSVKLTTADAPKNKEEELLMKETPYREAVGSLMYLSIATRPDISYAVGVLSRFSANPGVAHWKAVKHLMRYLKSTLDYKLTYAPDKSSDRFVTYSDADFAGEHDSKRSTSAYVVKMGSGAISWASRLQTVHALSTTEAEYISATSAAQEMLWLRNLFTEFGYPCDKLPLFMDNQSAIQVAKNPEHHGRMKHLDLWFYWLRNVVNEGRIVPTFVPTSAQVADIFTKPLARLDVQRCRELLGIVV